MPENERRTEGLKPAEVVSLIKRLLPHLRLNDLEIVKLEAEKKILAWTPRWRDDHDHIEDAVTPTEAKWIQGTRTRENPTATKKKIMAIKSIRDRLSYDLIAAKELADDYQQAWENGDVMTFQHQLEMWQTLDTPADELLTPQEKRWTATMIPPWGDPKNGKTAEYEKAHTSICLRYPTWEHDDAYDLLCAYRLLVETGVVEPLAPYETDDMVGDIDDELLT